MKLWYILLIFLVIGAFLVVKFNNYKLDNPDDRVSFVKDYGKWLFGVGKSVTNVAGAAIKEPWLPEKPESTPVPEQTKPPEKTYVVYE